MTSLVSLSRPTEAPGPVLAAVLAAQDAAAVSLDSSRIQGHARSLIDLAESLGNPLLYAVSPMAHRLVGAALVLGGGRVNAYDDRLLPIPEHSVLVVEAVAVRPTELHWHRDVLTRLGVDTVHCAALDLLEGRVDDPVFILSSMRPLLVHALH